MKASKSYVSSRKCWYIMTSVKMFTLTFGKFLSYLVCASSFKLINKSSLSRKKNGSIISPPLYFLCLWIRGQSKSVGIGLIKLTEPTKTLNYTPFFK